MDPRVKELAKKLGLTRRGDSLARVRRFALEQVQEVFAEVPVNRLSDLLRLVAAKLSIQLTFVRSDGDIRRIGQEHRKGLPGLNRMLHLDFLEGETEGVLLRRQSREVGERQYLAIIDARGPRRWRAYFTAWHELAHGLTAPPQIPLPGFRRSPSAEQKNRDPIERVVDDIAGRLAFYEPLFQPILEGAVRAEGGLTLTAIDRAREAVGPDVSFLSTAIASLRLLSSQACLVEVDLGLKKREEQSLDTSQQLIPGLSAAPPEPKLRVRQVIRSDAIADHPIRLFPRMRVPSNSVLHSVFNGGSSGVVLSADEDMSWWETSGGGSLPAQAVRVSAVYRGSYVYGLITPS